MGGATFIEEVGKGLVTESANSLLRTIASLAGEQIALAWGFKDDLNNFERKFKTIQLMVVNAAHNEDKIDNTVLDGWLKMVKDFIFQTEDVLDDYSYEMLRRKVVSNRYQHPCQSRRASGLSQLKVKTKVRLAIFKSWSSNPVVFRIRMANKLKSLKQGLAHIFAQANQLGIKAVDVGNAPSIYRVPETTRVRREHVDCESFIGRDTDKDEIINLLCDSNNLSQRLSVIGVYGMAEEKFHERNKTMERADGKVTQRI